MTLKAPLPMLAATVSLAVMALALAPASASAMDDQEEETRCIELDWFGFSVGDCFEEDGSGGGESSTDQGTASGSDVQASDEETPSDQSSAGDSEAYASGGDSGEEGPGDNDPWEDDEQSTDAQNEELAALEADEFEVGALGRECRLLWMDLQEAESAAAENVADLGTRYEDCTTRRDEGSARIARKRQGVGLPPLDVWLGPADVPGFPPEKLKPGGKRNAKRKARRPRAHR